MTALYWFSYLVFAHLQACYLFGQDKELVFTKVDLYSSCNTLVVLKNGCNEYLNVFVEIAISYDVMNDKN